MYEQKNKQRGITLIALVVSIIVLIILAGVSIAMLVGENGIITQAQIAKEETEKAQQNEEKGLQELEEYIDSSLGGETATTVAQAKGGMRYTNTTPIIDDSGNTIYIPGGFKIASDSATDISDGVVITDGINEFVWISVNQNDLEEMYMVAEEPIKLTGVQTATNIYSKLRVISQNTSIPDTPNSLNIREPDVLSQQDTDSQHYQDILEYASVELMAKAFVEEYEAIYESTKEYHGFYIGRYELTGSVENPTIQKGKEVVANQNWYNLKKACNLVVHTEYAQTTMIYGNQWDEVMDWLIDTGEKTEEQVNTDSSSWGNYTLGGFKTAGYSNSWKANNIYDLAGNYWEWTQEANTVNIRTTRGGGCSASVESFPPAGLRSSSGPRNAIINVSTRAILYIK